MQKIFKNGKQVYVLNDDNNYVQMTNSMSDNIVYPRYGIYFLKRDKIYATLIMQNETDIPYQNIIDEFQVLIFLKTHFSDDASTEFLKMCKSI